MKIEKLNVVNFRGVRQLEIELHSQTSVLVGANGTGKSTLLDAIRILLGDLLETAQSVRSGGPEYWHELEEQGDRYSCDPDSIRDGDVRIGENYFRIATRARIDSEGLDWFLEGNRNSNGNRMEMVHGGRRPNDIAILFERVELVTAGAPLVVYYSSGSFKRQAGRRKQEEEVVDGHDVYKSALDGSSPILFESFVSWFQAQEDYENEQRVDDHSFRDPELESVRHVVGELLRGFSGLRIRRRPDRMVIRKDDVEFELEQLSGGERYLLALGGDIARRLALANPHAPEPRRCSAVILVDEIESHLHPAWQRRIIPALERAFPHCQFIVSTHSPQVLSEVRPESIYLLRQENGELRVERPSASYGRDSNRILEDLMGADERPPEVKHKLQEYFKHIAVNNMDEARKLRRELEALIGPDEPEFARADAIIRARELLSSETDQ